MMKKFSINKDLVGSGELFPCEVEDLNWIGFHGTSSYYSEKIEKNGFDLIKPIPKEDLNFIIELSNKLSLETNSVEEFKDLNSISFSPISEICLKYLSPSLLGGQGVAYTLRRIDEVLDSYKSEIVNDDLNRLETIKDKIGKIKNSDPVIYAVNLEGIEEMEFQLMTKSIHVSTHIPKDRILAKLLIDKVIDYDQLDVTQFEQRIMRIHLNDQDHFINKI